MYAYVRIRTTDDDVYVYQKKKKIIASRGIKCFRFSSNFSACKNNIHKITLYADNVGLPKSHSKLMAKKKDTIIIKFIKQNMLNKI